MYQSEGSVTSTIGAKPTQPLAPLASVCTLVFVAEHFEEEAHFSSGIRSLRDVVIHVTTTLGRVHPPHVRVAHSPVCRHHRRRREAQIRQPTMQVQHEPTFWFCQLLVDLVSRQNEAIPFHAQGGFHHLRACGETAVVKEKEFIQLLVYLHRGAKLRSPRGLFRVRHHRVSHDERRLWGTTGARG